MGRCRGHTEKRESPSQAAEECRKPDMKRPEERPATWTGAEAATRECVDPTLRDNLSTVAMASQCQNKKEGTLEDLFSKTPAKKLDPLQRKLLTAKGAERGASPEDDAAPITKAFLERLLRVLCDNFATLKQEIAAEVKDLKREMAKVGQRLDPVKRTHDAQEEERD
ncbi:hypothetical protein NDU88_001572 [Pleurodeles waltl]|uniref:Uncharacterized protein n=1 Tax=Pleurodeles waltl TaxID=8319 RepID=A0AAV7MKW0_PLEWA|nr:hypothetical protein NDU88_001572 [Pleurodeles waltl]